MKQIRIYILAVCLGLTMIQLNVDLAEAKSKADLRVDQSKITCCPSPHLSKEFCDEGSYQMFFYEPKRASKGVNKFCYGKTKCQFQDDGIIIPFSGNVSCSGTSAQSCSDANRCAKADGAIIKSEKVLNLDQNYQIEIPGKAGKAN